MRDAFILIILAALAFALTKISRETWQWCWRALQAAWMGFHTMVEHTRAAIANRILRRRMAYRALFTGDDGELTAPGKLVLTDLVRFGRGLTSTSVVSPVTRQIDPIASALAEGRREMLLRILKELNVDMGEVFSLVKEEESYG